MLVKPVQEVNAPLPMLVTLLGITSSPASPEQP